MTPTENVNALTMMREILETGHGDMLRAMLASLLRDMMDAEVTEKCGAAHGERTASREAQRNGYRERPFETRLGTVDLAVPKLRQGSYFPGFLTPRRRWERAFVNVVSCAYVEGVSTRKVEALVEAMGAKGMSKSEVSRMATSLDVQVTEFRERRLDHTEFPYLWLDATRPMDADAPMDAMDGLSHAQPLTKSTCPPTAPTAAWTTRPGPSM